LVVLATLIAVVACSSGPNPRNSLDSKDYSFENAGLVVGRTLAVQGKGLSLEFHNIDTGAYHSTTSGLFGYTSFEYFAIWLPEGRYELDGIFAYNGGLGPASEALRFNVNIGRASYVGTLFQSWETKKRFGTLGKVVAVKTYARWECAPYRIKLCKPGDKDRKVVGPPYADVFVVDEGDRFVPELRAALSGIPAVNIDLELMR
jgi:hypothetical protein